MLRRRRLGLLAAVWLVAAPFATACAGPLDRLFGTYVGRAASEDIDGALEEERHLDIIIEPYKRTGFKLRWISVTLVDGRRDLPGVKRRVGESLFVPAEGKPYFVEAKEFNPFREREEIQPIAGDPVRWAVVDDNGLHVLAFVLLEDGRYELQVSTRRPNGQGLDLVFERIVDDRVLRRITGYAVRLD